MCTTNETALRDALIKEMLRPEDVRDHPLFHNPEVHAELMSHQIDQPAVSVSYSTNGCRITVVNGLTREDIDRAMLVYNCTRFHAAQLLSSATVHEALGSSTPTASELALLLQRAKDIEDALVLSLSDLANYLGRKGSRDAEDDLSLVWRAIRRAVQRYDLLQTDRDVKASIRTAAQTWIDGELKNRRSEAARSRKRDGELRAAAELTRSPKERKQQPCTPELKGERLGTEEAVDGKEGGPTQARRVSRQGKLANAIENVTDENRVPTPDEEAVSRELHDQLGSDLYRRLEEGDLTVSDYAEVFRRLANEPAPELRSTRHGPSWQSTYPILWEREWIEHQAVANGDTVEW